VHVAHFRAKGMMHTQNFISFWAEKWTNKGTSEMKINFSLVMNSEYFLLSQTEMLFG